MAPMEGVTGATFRRVHAECFGPLARYYTPFLPPLRVGCAFGKHHLREIDPALNQGLDVVPQLLTKSADEFVWAAGLLAELGYREVNLNAGCPAGTVVSKGKGAGLLRDAAALEAFLLEVCERSPLPVSVKTRAGLADDSEFDEILDAYCRCPLAELIVHPRVRNDFYKGVARRELYGRALARAPFPVAYNGDVFSVADAEALLATYPATRHAMLGRGVVTNPALAREIAGGPALAMSELRRFHDRLYGAYLDEIGGNAVFRMKEWWGYAKDSFADPLSVHRAVRKVRRTGEYEAAVEKVFANERLA